MKYKIILLIFVLMSVGFSSFSQRCFDDNTEDELLGYLKNIHRLQNQTGDDAMDSLYAENNKLYGFLTYSLERSYSIITDLNRLIYAGFDFSAADDEQCAVYSWEIYSYAGMHYRTGIIAYKTSQGIHTAKFTSGIAPYSITSVHTKDNQTVYLVFWEDCYSLKGRFKRVMANVIETKYGEETFAPISFFIDGTNGLISYLEYKYDLDSYLIPRDVPDLILSANRKKLSVPIVSQSGIFNGKYNVYNFNGHNFVLEKSK